jgi:serine/threonine protein phosphatase PrpC
MANGGSGGGKTMIPWTVLSPDERDFMTLNRSKMLSHGLSHQGKVRDHNEDSFLDLNSEGLWAVADGAGGHEKGEVASQLIIEELSLFKPYDDLKSSVNWIIDRLRKVNEQLILMRSDLTNGGLIGSTVCILFVHEKHCVCIWSGDSRVYSYQKSKLSLLTQDHNRMEEFSRAGFDEQELANYPVAGQLVKAVGATTILSVDVQLYELHDGEVFLLCSDGLTGELDDTEIAVILGEDVEPKSITEKLLESVLQRRARDNVTAIVVSF